MKKPVKIIGVVIDDKTGEKRKVELKREKKKEIKRDFVAGDEEMIAAARVNRERIREAFEEGNGRKLRLMNGARLRMERREG